MCQWGPRALMLGPLQRCPGAPALIWGWCPEDTAVQALEVGQGARGAYPLRDGPVNMMDFIPMIMLCHMAKGFC